METGAFGKEAYVLTGYFNLPKLLELALHDGLDPRAAQRLGPATGQPGDLYSFESLWGAFAAQLRHFVDIKIRGNQIIQGIYAREMPAPFLSTLIDDCVANGRDYNAGGARYNNTYLQMVGIGTLTDSLAALRRAVYEERALTLAEMVSTLDRDFVAAEPLRQRLVHRMPKYGNDDDAADDLMRRAFDLCFRSVDGRPTALGGRYRLQMLPTTCHVYFGTVTGATPDGRQAGRPLSEGISPVQGADRGGRPPSCARPPRWTTRRREGRSST